MKPLINGGNGDCVRHSLASGDLQSSRTMIFPRLRVFVSSRMAELAEERRPKHGGGLGR